MPYSCNDLFEKTTARKSNKKTARKKLRELKDWFEVYELWYQPIVMI